jgi:hypothetical protein
VDICKIDVRFHACYYARRQEVSTLGANRLNTPLKQLKLGRNGHFVY